MGIEIKDLGVVPYQEAVLVQEDILEKRISGKTGDTVLLLEHPEVVTLGRSASKSDIKNEKFFLDRGIQIIETKRGGGITYHSPGQLVVYPIISLDPHERDVSGFIDTLEKLTAGSLRELGVKAFRDPGKRGVWVSGMKIAFTGIKLRKWVTFHGVSVNINNDIRPFEMIDPCGDSGISVTSARIIKGVDLDMAKVKGVFIRIFKRLAERSEKYAFELA